MVRRLALVLLAAWLLGMILLVAAPPGAAEAGFFQKVKGKPDSSGAAASSGEKQQGGGFFNQANTKQPVPVAPPSSGSGPHGGLLLPAQGPALPTPGGVGPSGSPSVSGPRQGWLGKQGILGQLKTPSASGGWNAQGYFEQLRRELAARRRPDYYVRYWYYPYDYGYYYWARYHYFPWWVSPYYYGYGYPPYYYVSPPLIIIQEPGDWVSGESYIPYITWPSESLMEAKRDIEGAWRHEQIELLEQHLDPEHRIACYTRSEYTHSLSAEEFRQLTLDAFAAIRTVSFEFTSMRYVSGPTTARLKGRHVFYDVFDNRTVVYVSYLLRRIEYEGQRARWVIWEVRQSPYAE